VANDSDVGREILGVGWHFPVRVDTSNGAHNSAVGRASGGIALARHETDIEQAVRIILSTRPGERRMRPAFGCRIHELLFDPINARTFGLVRRFVTEALERWEPRIEVQEVEVDHTGAEGTIDISVVYEIRATKEERSLVYPFYVIDEE
jgi:phage baseplate assembly protein W